MAKTSPRVHRAGLLTGVVAVLGLLTGCGGGSDDGDVSAASTPPASAPASTSASASADGGGGDPTESGTATSGTPSVTGSASASRCHTSELRASVGRNNPGAGQENFPLVLTNTAHRTCTLRGYPGAAFLDASGGRLGPDPKRSEGTPSTVALAPGDSAWAGMSFANPEVSEARSATPAAVLVTPPDERDPLKVAWTGGPVPVAGNASTVVLTVFDAGTGS
ncbi:DUF4232 domain-containing protein [Streptomyces sp. NPDC005574]|uniref:DUF4232 domain-containing protein n=1 Tax=Streptomyces sp. NPDC005574 TaxID=3156891 RepID=UPI0033BA59AF